MAQSNPRRKNTPYPTQGRGNIKKALMWTRTHEEKTLAHQKVSRITIVTHREECPESRKRRTPKMYCLVV